METSSNVRLKTPFGTFVGKERKHCLQFLGIPYAKADRFAYAEEIESYEGEVDATSFGDACCQYREYFPHLDVPERKFYQREFRDGLTFHYSEDCLNLNIYTPKEGRLHPVVVFIHGGGFNSMANSESYLDGDGYAKRGVILITINYRVGVFGFLTSEETKKQWGHEGNFALSDMIAAFRWVKHHIQQFGGDPNKVTAMGQSAGAMSIQDLCCSEEAKGLFSQAIMMSGAGKFPSMGRPKKAEDTHEYWNQVIQASGAKDFASFAKLSDKEILEAVEKVKVVRKDNTQNTMPVVDGYYLKKDVGKLIRHPFPIRYLVGYTNRDMFTIALSHMAHSYSRKVHGYLYFFDVDAPGDDNQAFHSSDLRYAFGTLKASWRPYDEKDEKISEIMMDYFASFMVSGTPNGGGLPYWKPGGKALVIRRDRIKMGCVPKFKLLRNTFKGDPK